MNKNKFFWSIFADDNSINEKSVIGFISFAFIVMICIVDTWCAYRSIPFHPSDSIFNALIIITLGSLGISGAERIFKKEEIG